MHRWSTGALGSPPQLTRAAACTLQSKSTPLHYAARNGATDTVEVLLQHKADIGAKDVVSDNLPALREGSEGRGGECVQHMRARARGCASSWVDALHPPECCAAHMQPGVHAVAIRGHTPRQGRARS